MSMAWLHGDGKTKKKTKTHKKKEKWKEGKEKRKAGGREGRLITGHDITCL